MAWMGCLPTTSLGCVITVLISWFTASPEDNRLHCSQCVGDSLLLLTSLTWKKTIEFINGNECVHVFCVKVSLAVAFVNKVVFQKKISNKKVES